MKWKASTSGRTVSSLRGALDWRMVSNTSVEGPEAMSCAPSGATPTATTTPGGGEVSYPPSVRGDPSWRESPMESRRGEKSGPRIILGPARMGHQSRHTLARTPGSRAIGGKAYRRSLGQVCTIASSPSGAGWVRENQRGQCNISRVAKQVHLSWPTLSLHSPGLGPCFDRMSAPILRCPGMWTALNERSLPWDHTRIWCASL